MMTRVLLILIATCLFVLPSQSRAESMPPDPVMLVIQEVSGTLHEYRRSDLQKMRQVTFATTTIWTSGQHEFTGVPLADLLKDAGIAEGAIDLHAANDYLASVPLADIGMDAPVVAYLYDGKPMSLRDKGPLWLVYPYDADRKFQTETTYTRSVWQLVRIEAAKDE